MENTFLPFPENTPNVNEVVVAKLKDGGLILLEYTEVDGYMVWAAVYDTTFYEDRMWRTYSSEYDDEYQVVSFQRLPS